ncbi:MAG: hypothetical protein ACLPWS_05625 [Rhodomicrobium sp.]
MQVTQRRQRDPRDADLESAAIDRIELPGCHHRDDTGLELKMCDLFGRAPLNQNTTIAPAAQWMPGIMDNDIVPDMGRMTARLQRGENLPHRDGRRGDDRPRGPPDRPAMRARSRAVLRLHILS